MERLQTGSAPDERGATALEYALLAACVPLVALMGVTRVGAEIKRPIEAANEPLTQAVNFSSSGCAWEACPSVPGAGGGLEKK